MQPVLTPSEMAEADRKAIANGIPESVLIDRAGRALALATRGLLGGVYGRRAVVFFGKGHNGADGRVAARVLSGWGVRVDPVDVSSPVDRIATERAVSRADVLLDAMFGTGFRGRLEGDAAWCAELINGSGVAVIAADIPSGVHGGNGSVDGVAVRADRTICFQAWKPGLLFEPGRTLAGEVEIAELGIPASSVTQVVTHADVRVPPRPPDAHKWSRSVFVVGGSGGMVGAPLLSARAAARSGAGMVVVALPGSAARRASGTEIITREYSADPDGSFASESAAALSRDSARFGAVVLGPGLGRSMGADAVAARLIAEVTRPIVIDADALNVLAEDLAPMRVRATARLPMPVLTPHAGEYARLAGRPVGVDRLGAARDLAASLHAVVLLKGPGTVVASPDGTAVVVRYGGSNLATAGTGDVLAGVIGALLSAGMEPFAATWSAAAVHGVAADLTPYGSGTIASDVVAALALGGWCDAESPAT